MATRMPYYSTLPHLFQFRIQVSEKGETFVTIAVIFCFLFQSSSSFPYIGNRESFLTTQISEFERGL